MKRFMFVALFVAVATSSVFGSTELTDIISPLQRQQLISQTEYAPDLGALWMKHGIGSAVVTGLVDKVYTGSGITPSIGVFLDGGQTKLTNNTDYVATYATVTNVGRYAVTIAANKKGYYGSLKLHYNVLPATITATMIGTIAQQSYTGSAITPTPTITFNGKTLTKDVDYTLSYKNNIKKSSKALVRVTGKGNFTGYADKFFTIGD